MTSSNLRSSSSFDSKNDEKIENLEDDHKEETELDQGKIDEKSSSQPVNEKLP